MKDLNLIRIKRSANLKSYIHYSEDFCPLDFCNTVIEESQFRTQRASVIGSEVKDKKIRDACDVVFSSNDPVRISLGKYFTRQLLNYVELFKFRSLNTSELFPEICVVSYKNQKGYLPHVDAFRPYNERRETRFISIVAYLNDDYVGGDVYFPEIGVSFKPKKGSCLVFPSDDLFLHGVKPVKGFKLISPCWFHSKTLSINPFGF